MYFKNCEVAFGKRDDFARNAKLQSALVVFVITQALRADC